MIEEIIGRVSDEFEPVSTIPLGSLTTERVTLGLEAQSIDEGIARAMNVGNGSRLRARITRSAAPDGRLTSTYIGNGLAVAHGVSDALDEPVTFFGRSDSGIPLDGVERVHGLFVVVLPIRMQQAESETVDSVASLLESEYVRDVCSRQRTPKQLSRRCAKGCRSRSTEARRTVWHFLP